jgi:hypothetical protein
LSGTHSMEQAMVCEFHRLLNRRCELCERDGTVAVHQVAALRQLGKPGPDQPPWAALMAKKHRKTLIVCAPCQ